MAVGEQRHQPAHRRYHLHVSEPRDGGVDALHLGVEALFADELKGPVRPPLHFAGQDAEVKPPACVSGDPVQVDQADQLAESRVSAKVRELLPSPGCGNVPKPEPHGLIEPLEGRVRLAELGVAGGDPVSSLCRVGVAQLESLLIGGYGAAQVLSMPSCLAKLEPVAAVDGIRGHHSGPQPSCPLPVLTVGAGPSAGQRPKLVARRGFVGFFFHGPSLNVWNSSWFHRWRDQPPWLAVLEPRSISAMSRGNAVGTYVPGGWQTRIHRYSTRLYGPSRAATSLTWIA